jgi:uncharacterized membrane protein
MPDPAYGKSAKQRSLHNNYLTLPAIFLMLSNHYPLAFASRWNWVIAAIVMVIGALIRHFYNSRHAGNGSPWWTWAAAGLGGLCIILLSSAGPVGEQAGSGAPVRFAMVEEIVTSRCSMCHAGEPVWDGLATAPKGVRLDSAEAIARHAREIGLQAVATHAMPPGGNITEISDADRQVLADWIKAGAPYP